MEKLFDPAGLTAAPSSGGLIARQLISRVGGVQGGRVFKIPGVRRLLKTHGPAAAVTMRAALQMIGERDPRNPAIWKPYLVKFMSGLPPAPAAAR
jgi:hypothetical protein